VAVWATNYPQWLTLLFATAKIGVVLVTVNTNYKRAELEYLLHQSDSVGLFICDGLKDIDCEKTIYSLCPELKTCKPGKLKSAALPRLRSVISFDNYYDGMYHWNHIPDFGVLISDEEYAAAKAALSPDDVINIQYTSGTTGFPKGVMLSHYNILNNGYNIGECLRFTDKDRLCICVPFFHCFGLVLSITMCVTHGSTMVPIEYYSPLEVMEVVQKEKCTALNGVPTMFILILEHPDFNKYDFSTLRAGIMAGSPCPIKTMQDVVDKMNMRHITSVYGLTEASPGLTQTRVEDPLEVRVSTVGRELPDTEIKIINPETGEEVPNNVSGELCARGYCLMKGYYKMPEATKAAIDEDGWLHTGDLAYRDDDGYYHISGRIKDMIIRGGENIYPKEIEELLYTHPKIKDVQVVGVPSKKFGEEIMAYIILKDGEELTQEEVKQFVMENMARHKVPAFVEVVSGFPMTASGKIQKYKLREMAIEKYNLQEAAEIETA